MERSSLFLLLLILYMGIAYIECSPNMNQSSNAASIEGSFDCRDITTATATCDVAATQKNDDGSTCLPFIDDSLSNHPIASSTTTTTTTINIEDSYGTYSSLIRWVRLFVIPGFLLSIKYPFLITIIAATLSASRWMFWVGVGGVFTFMRSLFVIYNFLMVLLDLIGLIILKAFAIIRSFTRQHAYYKVGTEPSGLRRRKEWRDEVDGVRNYEEYSKINLYEPEPLLGETSCTDWQQVVKDDLGDKNGSLLLSTLEQLNKGDDSSLPTLLSGIVKRNHLSLDDILIRDAQSVAERGQHILRKETRDTIAQYMDVVEKSMERIVSGVSQENLSKRHALFNRMKQNMGNTALMLSGGGAQAMYHVGTIKALCESKLYERIHVISGTSGGSIIAAMCAIKTPQELLRDVCINTVSTDFMQTGQMKRESIKWFPSPVTMALYWMKNGLMVDSDDFLRCCELHYSDITFEEAYEMTKKHVCINVSASRASAGSGMQRLLLNHISTPNVTLASAVAASCALPGVMAPRKLMVKDSNGNKVPFEVDGVEWIDGSVQADLPFKRISVLFNVTNFVAAQTNPHIVPFLKSHQPNINSLYWNIFQSFMSDVQSRVLNLSQLGLFPRIFGHDMTSVFKQKYHGKITLVPRFTTMQVFGLKLLVNPSTSDMEHYIKNGQLAAWPFIAVLKVMLQLEQSLSKLDKRLGSESGVVTHCSNDVTYNNQDQIKRQLLKAKIFTLEQENNKLRQKVLQYQNSLRAFAVPRPLIVKERSNHIFNGSENIELKEGEEDFHHDIYSFE